MITFDKHDPTSRHHSLNDASALLFRAKAEKRKGLLCEVIDWLSVETSERYDNKEHSPACNIYASDVCYLCNVPFPPANYRDFKINELETEFTANLIAGWLAVDGRSLGWRSAESFDDAQFEVNRGAVGIIVAKSLHSKAHGHITIVVPETSTIVAKRESGEVVCPVQSTAGRQRYGRFANLNWWNAERHEEPTIWLVDPPSKSVFQRQTSQTVYSRLIQILIPQHVEKLHAQMLYSKAQLNGFELEENVLNALILAEDRRFMSHSGYDVKGILRAFFRYIYYGRREGASTIEQQLVRTLTNQRQLSFRRKILEIFLARWSVDHFEKKEIATIYISNAYYGWRMNNLRQAYDRLRLQAPLSQEEACLLVALLRTPLPKVPSVKISRRIENRVNFLKKMVQV